MLECAMTPQAKHCMDVIRELLAEPKPAGKWWAHEVIALHDLGRPVSLGAIEMARKVLRLDKEGIIE